MLYLLQLDLILISEEEIAKKKVEEWCKFCLTTIQLLIQIEKKI